MDKLSRFELNVVAAWFGATSITLFLSLVFLLFISTLKVAHFVATPYKLYSALPPSTLEDTDLVVAGDARAKMIEQFFKGYNAPLADHSQLFIDTAQKYGLDWRLLPAIAMQESNGGRRIIQDSYNPFGFGIYGSKVIRFDSWDDAIKTVGESLREDYLDQGLKTPEQIMTKYTPPSLAKGGAWAKGVQSFMEELR